MDRQAMIRRNRPRVVITGLGALTPLGLTAEETWEEPAPEGWEEQPPAEEGTWEQPPAEEGWEEQPPPPDEGWEQPEPESVACPSCGAPNIAGTLDCVGCGQPLS